MRTAAEKIRHIDRLTRRAADRLPLFGDGPPAPVPDKRDRCRCIGCDRPVGIGKGGVPAGWAVERVSRAIVFMHCPACERNYGPLESLA